MPEEAEDILLLRAMHEEALEEIDILRARLKMMLGRVTHLSKVAMQPVRARLKVSRTGYVQVFDENTEIVTIRLADFEEFEIVEAEFVMYNAALKGDPQCLKGA